MDHAQWLLEPVLILLLGATLFHAMRLERALGVLKRDRAVLEELVAGFNESTRQAEHGIERLRLTADGAGRQIARQIEQAQLLRDELEFLTNRSDKLAERLETTIRSARMVQDSPPYPRALPPPAPVLASAGPLSFDRHRPPGETVGAAPVTALRDNLAAGNLAADRPARVQAGSNDAAGNDAADLARLRSQAERDLLRALRGGR